MYRNSKMKLISTIFVFTNLLYAECFYLPGLAPVNFCKKEDESEKCKVSKLLPVNPIEFPENSFISV